MADIACPECGQVATLPAIRRSADEFCRHCDYPLFWAPTAAPHAVATETNEAMLRRLPGVAGRLLIGTEVCPECGELNPMGTVFCIRCTAPLHPIAEPEPAPAPPPPPPPPPPEPVRRSRWWLWLIAAAVLGLATAVVLVWLT